MASTLKDTMLFISKDATTQSTYSSFRAAAAAQTAKHQIVDQANHVWRSEEPATCMKAFQVFVRSNSTMRAMTCHRGASNSASSFTLWTLLSAEEGRPR